MVDFTRKLTTSFIQNLILSLKFESLLNRRPKWNGLESKSSTIGFHTPNRLSLVWVSVWRVCNCVCGCVCLRQRVCVSSVNDRLCSSILCHSIMFSNVSQFLLKHNIFFYFINFFTFSFLVFSFFVFQCFNRNRFPEFSQQFFSALSSLLYQT